MTSFARIEAIFDRVATAMALIGGLGLLFATVSTCLSIILKMTRRFLDTTASGFLDPEIWSSIRPILGEEELVQYSVGFALFSVLPLVMIRRGHIRIDLFESRFGTRANRLLDLIGDIALAAIAYLIMTRQWGLIFARPRRNQETLSELLFQGDLTAIFDRVRTAQETQILGLPLWPFYIVAEICIIAFFVVAVFCVIRSARTLFLGKQVTGSDNA
ncbi:MAG: TRAP transporter small permease [Pseudomonadota bacterium]